jgi:hypothetical protein
MIFGASCLSPIPFNFCISLLYWTAATAIGRDSVEVPMLFARFVFVTFWGKRKCLVPQATEA